LSEPRIGWLGERAYAHRGLHGPGVPENSLEAASGAIAAGMGIECDVQLTRDGEAAVFHDWELERLTAESGPVARRTLAQLEGVALTGGGGLIPGLPKFLALVAGRVPLLIEIKAKREVDPVPLCQAVLRGLDGYAGPVAIMSFDPRVPRWFARRAPQVVRGLVVTEEDDPGFLGTLRRHLWLWLSKPDFLAYDIRDLPSRFASAQRRRGLPLLTWTVRTPELRERAELYADAPIAEGAGVQSGGRLNSISQRGP
jgi:glycerophosphoryl diester phosphodiesterase